MKKVLLWENAPELRLIVSSRHATRTAHFNRGPFSLHRHPFFELGIVLTGRCDWRIRGRPIHLAAGQAILVKAGTDHREELSWDRSTELAWLGFDFKHAAPRWSERPVTLGEDFPEVVLGFQAIYHEHSKGDPITRMRVRLALQNILLLVSRQAENAASPLRKTEHSQRRTGLNTRQVRAVEASAHYFRNNFKETLSVAQVAAYHSLCPAYFSTLFRRHLGLAPRAYLQKVKVEHAAELLQTTELTIKEISARCGFVDAAHLAKTFKQKHRLAPGLFRRRQRG